MVNDLPQWWTSRSQDDRREIACQDPRSIADRVRLGAIHANGHRIAPLEYTGPRSAHHTEATGVSRLLPAINSVTGINKRIE